MTANEIKKHGMYKTEVTIREMQCSLLVKVVDIRHDKGTVEVIFPPFNECLWLPCSEICPLG